MEGITILNTIITTSAAPISCIIFAIGIAMTFVLVGAGCSFNNKICFILALISMITGLVFISFGPKVETTTYQVLIDDSVSFVELNQKYSIIGQNGQIYTIIEKELSE